MEPINHSVLLQWKCLLLVRDFLRSDRLQIELLRPEGRGILSSLRVAKSRKVQLVVNYIDGLN